MESNWDSKLGALLSGDVITGYALTSHQGFMLSEPKGHMASPETAQGVLQLHQYLPDTGRKHKRSYTGIPLHNHKLQVRSAYENTCIAYLVFSYIPVLQLVYVQLVLQSVTRIAELGPDSVLMHNR